MNSIALAVGYIDMQNIYSQSITCIIAEKTFMLKLIKIIKPLNTDYNDSVTSVVLDIGHFSDKISSL